ncbi:hypothetical protein X975_17313, partial [Stegodyphus mimosarum]
LLLELREALLQLFPSCQRCAVKCERYFSAKASCCHRK